MQLLSEVFSLLKNSNAHHGTIMIIIDSDSYL